MLRRAVVLAVAALLFATADVAASTEHDVSIVSFSFSPTPTAVAIGDFVRWTNNASGTTQHTTTSDAVGLWDSGHLAVNSSFSHTFDDAGTFTYHCSIHHQMKGTVTVALQASATSGAKGTSFTLTVADATAPAGWTHEVQKAKGAGSFAAWKSTTGQTVMFKPKKKGTYRFEARLRKTGTSTASGWSPVVTITIS